jgi:hypothetical protein
VVPPSVEVALVLPMLTAVLELTIADEDEIEEDVVVVVVVVGPMIDVLPGMRLR